MIYLISLLPCGLVIESKMDSRLQMNYTFYKEIKIMKLTWITRPHFTYLPVNVIFVRKNQ